MSKMANLPECSLKTKLREFIKKMKVVDIEEMYLFIYSELSSLEQSLLDGWNFRVWNAEGNQASWMRKIKKAFLIFKERSNVDDQVFQTGTSINHTGKYSEEQMLGLAEIC